MYPVRIPFFSKWLFPKAVTRIPGSKHTVYLTFDDGPIPAVTPWVLGELKRYNAGATFFCIGDNVLKHPDVYQQVLDAGHSTGNHTFNHLNGWKTSLQKYLLNVKECADVMDTKLFRPPYGRMRKTQYRALSRNYRIVLWHTLSGDFDATISAEKCYQNVIRNLRPGAVIVFHDSLKAEKHLRAVLPRVLDYLYGNGFESKAITSN